MKISVRVCIEQGGGGGGGGGGGLREAYVSTLPIYTKVKLLMISTFCGVWSIEKFPLIILYESSGIYLPASQTAGPIRKVCQQEQGLVGAAHSLMSVLRSVTNSFWSSGDVSPV